MRYDNFTIKICKHHGRLLKYVSIFAGEDTEDVVQDTYAAVYRHKDRLAHHDDLMLMPLLKKVAKDIYCDRMRRQKVERRILAEIRRDHLRYPVMLDTIALIQQRDDTAELYAAVQSLSETHRRIIILKYFYEEPMTEVARLLGLKYTTALDKRKAAVEELRKILESERPEWFGEAQKTVTKNNAEKMLTLYIRLAFQGR